MKNILVVEDGLTDAQFATLYLQQAGYKVIVAKSSEEADEKLKTYKPDLILLDVVLPGKSGFEFCHKLKTDAQNKLIPIAICSTKNTEADKMLGNMLGADAYLAKPLDQGELINTVRKLTAS